MPPRSSRTALLALEQIGIKLGLDQIRALVERLGRPDRAFPSIIVAGTNGKGSVTAMIERGLRAAGLRTGRFTSPHLVDLEERFAVNGEPISAETLDDAAGRVLDAASGLPAPPSFFEATTALALDVFRNAPIDVAVLEVGLGGRLDATNVVNAKAAVITSVDFDHEEYLGRTIDAIAGEKAAVIKPGALAVLAANPPAVDRVVERAAVETGARLVKASDGVTTDVHMVDGRANLNLRTPTRSYGTIRLSLAGRHQVNNAVTAVRLLEALPSELGFEISESAIVVAVQEVVWPARLETITVSAVEVLLDGAHNPAGAGALAAHVLETYRQPLPLIVGAMRDKALDALVAALAPAASHFVFTAASTPRAAAPIDLLNVARQVSPGVPAVIESQPIRAVSMAAAFGSPVVVAGSLYLAGEIRAARS